MNGVHDMGGMDGFGKVEPEPNEPVFHAAWEARVMAMNRAMGAAGVWNIDMSRSSREVLPPDVYLASSYYRKWFLGMEQMLLERGLVDADEVAGGHALRPGKSLERTLTADHIAPVMTRGSFARPTSTAARFKPSDRVRAKNIHPLTHTRLPRYVRGRVGVVDRVHGSHVFPDASATGRGDDPQWLYTVAFAARDLWGDDADPTVQISIEAFEPYLEPAA
jgi:nitrile hydratase subunit beta